MALKCLLCCTKYLWLVVHKLVVVVYLLDWEHPQVAKATQKTAELLWHCRRIPLQQLFQNRAQCGLEFTFIHLSSSLWRTWYSSSNNESSGGIFVSRYPGEKRAKAAKTANSASVGFKILILSTKLRKTSIFKPDVINEFKSWQSPFIPYSKNCLDL